MLSSSRRQFLLARLERDGHLVAKELAEELEISEDSVRRDLRDLAADGLLIRVYGGALPASPATANYTSRSGIEVESKARVAAAAAALIHAGNTVILDGGTTALALVQAIPHALEFSIITHSPTIASALLEHAAEVELLGGKLDKRSAVTSGAAAAEAANRVRADLFFLGVTGVHPTFGLTTGDLDAAAMKRTLATRAADTYVLASAEKVGAVSPHQVLPLGSIAALIIDGTGHPEILDQFREQGTSLIEVG